MVIKYYVERSFKDKYSKKNITAKSIIDVTVERMKELNSKSIGRVVDIIENENVTKDVEKENTDIETEETDNNENTSVENTDSNTNTVYTKEELSKMTVNDLKDLAESLNIELTKAKKEEIVEEILLNNK